MVAHPVRVILQATEIRETLQKLAAEIVEKVKNPEDLVLIGIHTGGVFLARRLQEIISKDFGFLAPVGSLDITLYRDDWTRLHTQPLLRSTDLPFPIDDREVILVDDVLYTGRTIRAALDALIDYGRPRRVQVAVLVDRGHRELPICGQFIGIQLDTALDEQVNVLLTEKSGLDQVVIERSSAV
ncbi:MAG: bifunctional pyr operon transcriptional regulator/uracil phosphoribosyltransferase PyrR [Desulfoferrobacter sp.]